MKWDALARYAQAIPGLILAVLVGDLSSSSAMRTMLSFALLGVCYVGKAYEKAGAVVGVLIYITIFYSELASVYRRMADEGNATASFSALWFNACLFLLVLIASTPHFAMRLKLRFFNVLALLGISIGPFYLLCYRLIPVWVDESNGSTRIFFIALIACVISLAAFISLDLTSDEIKQKERMHERYVAALSHDLGTPIAALKMATGHLADYSRISLSPEDDAAVKALLNGITASLEVMQSIKRKAVDIGRLHLGERPTPSLEAVDLREMIMKKLPAVLHYYPHSENVHIQYNVSENISPKTQTDGAWVLLILLNFLSNSLKATMSGSISVDVRLANGFLRLCVSDSGCGISPEIEKQLWQPLDQSGTGLGLYHVKQLALALGGQVRYQPNVQAGGGSTFWADLPYNVVVDSPASEEPFYENGLQDEKEEAVLVVEDNVFILELTEALVKNTGMPVVKLATDGERALKILQARDAPTFSFVLMDVQMPFMNGIECTRRIRAWEVETGRPRLPIYALTANGEDATCQRDCMQAGMDGVLCKPLEVQRLFSLLQKTKSPGTGGLSSFSSSRNASGRVSGRFQRPAEGWSSISRLVAEEEPSAAPSSKESSTSSKASPKASSPPVAHQTLPPATSFPPPPAAPAPAAPAPPTATAAPSPQQQGPRTSFLPKEEPDLSYQKRVAKSFYEDSVKILQPVISAIDEGDTKKLKTAAHSLKGICSFVGAPCLLAISTDLEHKASRAVDQGVTIDASEYKNKILDEVALLKEAIRDFLGLPHSQSMAAA